MTDLLSAISAILPAIPFEAPQGTTAPYCVYVKNETPVRTKDGICGYDGTLTVAVYAATIEAVTSLAKRITAVVDNATFDKRDYYYESSSETSYSDIGLIQKDLTFTYIE